MMSYDEFDPDDHMQPIGFQESLRYSESIYNDKQNNKLINNYSNGHPKSNKSKSSKSSKDVYHRMTSKQTSHTPSIGHTPTSQS